MKDSFSITNELAQSILAKHGLGNLSTVREIHTGSINPVFVLNELYILRINTKSDSDSKQKFEKEAFLYKVLSNTELPTSDCLANDISHETIDHDYLVLSFIQGETLTTAFDVADMVTKSRLSFELGAILHNLHYIDIKPLNAMPQLFGHRQDWKKSMDSEFSKHLNYVQSKDLLTTSILESIAKTSEEYLALPEMSDKYTLIHGDYSRDNIQVRDGHIVGLFDFEMAQLGDPFYDLQKLPIKFQLGAGFDRNAFLAGYGMQSMTRDEKIRLSRYAISQGLWEIWATDTETFDYGVQEMQEGKELIVNAI